MKRSELSPNVVPNLKSVCTDPHHCITCSDEGIQMCVCSVDAEFGIALCSGDGGVESEVMIALVEDVQPGDTLLVHAATAIARLAASTDLHATQ